VRCAPGEGISSLKGARRSGRGLCGAGQNGAQGRITIGQAARSEQHQQDGAHGRPDSLASVAVLCLRLNFIPLVALSLSNKSEQRLVQYFQPEHPSRIRFPAPNQPGTEDAPSSSGMANTPSNLIAAYHTEARIAPLALADHSEEHDSNKTPPRPGDVARIADARSVLMDTRVRWAAWTATRRQRDYQESPPTTRLNRPVHGPRMPEAREAPILSLANER
jgi:hypothetical protein